MGVEHYIVFNNRNSLDLDIVIDEEWLPPVQDAEDEVELIKVPGRDGVLTIKKGRKEPVYKKVTCVLLNTDRKAEVRKWLKGEGKLILSNDSDVFYKAKIITPIQYYYHWSEGWQFEIEFLCEPYGYLHSGEKKIEITTKPYILTNPSDEISKPFIRVYGTGLIDFIINDQLLKLDLVDYIDIDSELMVSYRDINLVPFQGDFPVFKAGENTITWDGNITKLEIIPRWRR